MGLTKEYLRYKSLGVFGVVASKNCNAAFLKPLRFIVTGGTDVVTIWDTRFHRKVKVFKCPGEATILKPNDESTLLAAGMANGSLSIYDLKDKGDESSPDPIVTLEGHTSGINCLDWDDSETLLASGGRDTKIIIWDSVSEIGIAKLKGHKGPVTQVKFWKNSSFLLSSSIDLTLRLWDMSNKDCVLTVAANSPIRNFDIWSDYVFLAQAQIQMFKLIQEAEPGQEKSNLDWKAEDLGTLIRSGHDKAAHCKVIENRFLLVVGTKSSQVEVFNLRTEAEAGKSLTKRLKKNPFGDKMIVLRDLVRKGIAFTLSEGHIKSTDYAVGMLNENNFSFLFCLPSNQVEVITWTPPSNVNTNQTPAEVNEQLKSQTCGFDGHRKIIRGLSFSSDKAAILSASQDAFKVWNRKRLANIVTIRHDHHVVSAKFCPGDRHFVAGTSSGEIILGDISTAEIIQIETCGSEDDSIWNLDIYHNNLGFGAVIGKVVQFFDFSLSNGKLRFDLSRQLILEESSLTLKISSDMKYVAIGLLDSTIKVFYLDTLKFHLAMYGHKLPILSLDISSDGKLVASASGDKTVKIWGMDFGDCHTTWIHGDGLVGISFVEKSHHLISVAKDTINIYDADNFQRIQTIKTHFEGGSSSMAVGGLFVATAGKDQAIRLFQRSDELLVLEDERETEREAELDKESRRDNEKTAALQTAESEKSADKLIEALDIFQEKPTANPLITAYGAKDYKEFFLKVIQGIKASELEQSLMLLPIAYVNAMIPAISSILENYPLATELAIRCLTGLMKFHLASFNLSNKMEVAKLAQLSEKRVKDLEDIIEFNMGGLRFLGYTRENRQLAREFREMTRERKRKRKGKEKAVKRAILSIH